VILFEKDWLKYPGAIIHYETKNKSFLRLAEIYYRMGIKNNAFILSLLDPDIKDLDPYSEDLTLHQKGKILRECQRNPWYFFREVIRIPIPGSIDPIMFKADRANIALYWLFFNHVMTIVVILRQTGKTTSLMSLVSYLLNFGATNVFINLLTKSEGLKAETLLKGKQLFEELPDYLNMSTKKDIFNTDEIRLKSLSNVFKGNLSSSSPKQAEKVGRGFTSPINIIDEAAFVENIAIAMGAMLMSGNAAREFARQNNQKYGTILATTAGDSDDRDGSYIYALCNGAALWDEHFFDCEDEESLNKIIFKNLRSGSNSTKRPIVNITLSYRQLGYDEEWLKRRLEENISTPENIQRDIFNQWLSGSSNSPIPKKYLNILKENIIEQPLSEFYAPYNYLLRWYKPLEEIDTLSRQVNFIVGIDTSDAVGRDDIAFVVRNHYTGEVLCTAIFNEVNLFTLADFFVSFLLKYDNSFMVIERRSSAAAIIDYMIQKLLLNDINPFTRLYNTIFQEKEKYTKEFEEITKAKLYNEEVFIKHKKHIGFATSGSGITSRNELYSNTLMNMLKYTSHVTYDQQLITQISSLIIKNKRIDHPPGGNDDLVIASLLSYWLLINGKNLDYYSINTSTILKGNTAYLEEKYSSDKEQLNTDEIVELEGLFNDLVEKYKEVSNPIIAKQLEMRIKKLAEELKSFDHVISIEDLLETINREKRLRRYN
jgi:hypothetical protein